MRVLQVCPYSWDAAGGVKTHVGELAVHLRRLGHEVLVAAPARTHPPEPGLRIVGRPLPVRFNGSTAWVCLGRRSIARVRDVMREFHPDIVHVHEPLNPGVAMSATMLAPGAVVATFHANYPRSLASALYTLEARLLTPVWRRPDVCLAVSRMAARSIESRVRRRVRVVPNGIDARWFDGVPATRPPGPRRLLFVGRLEPRKGFAVALEAFASLAARFADLEFVVAGDGPERRAAGRLPANLGARLTMLGPTPAETLRAEYRAAEVFIAPATGSESFGIVLLEAMAGGVPVVASDITGYREVVRDGIDGLLVPAGDASALARAVERVLTDDGLAARLRGAGVPRAREFAWETVGSRIEAAYAEALDARRGGLPQPERAPSPPLAKPADAAELEP